MLHFFTCFDFEKTSDFPDSSFFNLKRKNVGFIAELKISLCFSVINRFKVCFLVSDNVFSQIFCNCFYLSEIFSWHN